jgi:hypothetical protein
MGEHKCVITWTARSESEAASKAIAFLVNEFPNLRFGLLVGVAGAAPTPGIRPGQDKKYILLGDVVVSKPENGHSRSTAIVVLLLHLLITFQLEYSMHEGVYSEMVCLRGPIWICRHNFCLQHLKVSRQNIPCSRVKWKHTSAMRQEDSKCFNFRGENQIYSSVQAILMLLEKKTVQHATQLRSKFNRRENTLLSIMASLHYGLVASSNEVIRDANRRDEYRKERGVLCWEIEAPGSMNFDAMKCLVIRGICDYADSHKNDQWQNYAALTAAAYAKDLLGYITPNTLDQEPLWASKMSMLTLEYQNPRNEPWTLNTYHLA